MLPLQLLFCSALAVSAYAAQQYRHDSTFQPDYSLHVTYDYAAVGCRYRYSALVNGTSPGPILTLQENRTSWVRVYNDMSDSNLTMHWHGLSQSVAPFSDGTPVASQWPITPHHYFDYELHPEVGEAGTYFYHSHVEFQAVSAAGPLIVKEAEDLKPPYIYDEERIMLISELYNKTDAQVVQGLSQAPQNFIWSGETSALLVNGKGIAVLNNTDTQTLPPYSYPPNSSVPSCELENIRVDPGKTYRFRVMGATAVSLVTFAIEGHDDVGVIAADGKYTKLASTDHIQVGSGQRFDFLLRTKSYPELLALNKTKFWIQLETRFRPVNTTSYAVLSYDSSKAKITTQPSRKPLSLSSNVQGWLESTLQPLKPNGFPSASQVTRTVYLKSAQIYTQNNILWTANNRTWTETNEHLANTSVYSSTTSVGTPYLVSIYEHGEAAIPDYDRALSYGGWDPVLNVYAGKVEEIIDIVIINEPNDNVGGFDAHPWHIHGGHIFDLGSGPGDYNATQNEEKFKTYTPVLRDTTYIYEYIPDDGVGIASPYSAQGWRAWRLHIQDAGVWMVHCHILQPMIMGMQTVWVMGNASEITAHKEIYSNGYLEYGGNAYGNSSYNPLVAHYYG